MSSVSVERRGAGESLTLLVGTFRPARGITFEVAPLVGDAAQKDQFGVEAATLVTRDTVCRELVIAVVGSEVALLGRLELAVTASGSKFTFGCATAV